MKTHVETQTIIVLKLTKEEAQWLRSYLQNPKGEIQEESKEDFIMRSCFFNHLTEAGTQYS